MPIDITTDSTCDGAGIIASATRASRAIPPLWPLSSSVAVNPFLGQTQEPPALAAARLRRIAGASITPPRAWHLDRMRSGDVTDDDLSAALGSATAARRPQTLAALKQTAESAVPAPRAIPTVAELAAEASGLDWPGLVAERIGHWAAGYFDRGQALWSAPKGRSAWAAWRAVATRDLTPEVMGLKGFARLVADAPDAAGEAIVQSAKRLRLTANAAETYFHQLLAGLGGYSQYARYLLWQAELAHGSDETLTDFLAIRLAWEVALLQRYETSVKDGWRRSVAAHAEPLAAEPADIVDEILLEAAERASQRRYAAMLSAAPAPRPDHQPALQAAFCIDVRSEVFRRALESLDPGIATLGFAGFFGLAMAHRSFASDVTESRCPVLLAPALRSFSADGGPAALRSEQHERIAARARRAWGRFKLAAVSSFAFVEAAGPLHAGKLVRDAFGFRRSPPSDPPPRFETGLGLAVRLTTAESVLRAMSFTDRFARLVLVVGHGATVANNPHASALQCGACGGHGGEVNTRLLAGLLNEEEVRAGLAQRGITIPRDTHFIGAVHDTTTDMVTLHDTELAPATHTRDIERARGWLARAGALARGERALRLPRVTDGGDVARRAHDWAEIRPEWGLAGCQAFIAAPRCRTASLDLAGRAFLHDYDWHADKDFKVLELIMTAPVVVASWISLQYYGSSVAPALFGGGNKLLHNVTGGIGVVEGNGGLLRGGLPWQSVHDGERLVHEPVRLSVYIEAPREAMNAVLDRHPDVRALFDNRWIHLLALDNEGRCAWRYAGGQRWVGESPAEPAAPARECA